MACAIECLHLPELQKITNQIKLMMSQPTAALCASCLHRAQSIPALKNLPTRPPVGPESAFYVRCW